MTAHLLTEPVTIYFFTERDLLIFTGSMVLLTAAAVLVVVWAVNGLCAFEDEEPATRKPAPARRTGVRRRRTPVRHDAQFTPGVSRVDGAIAERTTDNLRGSLERVWRP